MLLFPAIVALLFLIFGKIANEIGIHWPMRLFFSFIFGFLTYTLCFLVISSSLKGKVATTETEEIKLMEFKEGIFLTKDTYHSGYGLIIVNDKEIRVKNNYRIVIDKFLERPKVKIIRSRIDSKWARYLFVFTPKFEDYLIYLSKVTQIEYPDPNVEYL